MICLYNDVSVLLRKDFACLECCFVLYKNYLQCMNKSRTQARFIARTKKVTTKFIKRAVTSRRTPSLHALNLFSFAQLQLIDRRELRVGLTSPWSFVQTKCLAMSRGEYKRPRNPPPLPLQRNKQLKIKHCRLILIMRQQFQGRVFKNKHAALLIL